MFIERFSGFSWQGYPQNKIGEEGELRGIFAKIAA
jgi:hypothetical protein